MPLNKIQKILLGVLFRDTPDQPRPRPQPVDPLPDLQPTTYSRCPTCREWVPTDLLGAHQEFEAELMAWKANLEATRARRMAALRAEVRADLLGDLPWEAAELQSLPQPQAPPPTPDDNEAPVNIANLGSINRDPGHPFEAHDDLPDSTND